MIKKLSPLDKDLNYFIGCADCQSLSRAAELLDVQQAGLSKIIARLEHKIGEKLFFRSPKGLLLTEFGKKLYLTLKKTNEFWQEIYSNIIESQASPAGLLTIGCHPSIAGNTFHKIYPALVENFPLLQIESQFLTSLEITKMVAQLQIDIGLVINPVKNPDLIIRKIHSEYTALWGSANSPIVLYNPDMYLIPRIQKKFQDRRMIPIKDYEVIAQMTKQSGYSSLLPNTIAERHSLRSISSKLFSVDLCLIWHKDKFKSGNKFQVIESVFRSLK